MLLEDSTDYKYDISVVVLCYNSTLEAILNTLQSIVIQQHVSFEIIVVDDGSVLFPQQEVEDFFENKRFNDYQIILNTINRGTVCNFNIGMSAARGRYTKAISPGDCLTSSIILHQWIDYLCEHRLLWSFSDAIYYDYITKELLEEYAFPQLIEPYYKNKQETARWNYLVLGDVALGSTLIGLTSLQRMYCKKLLVAGVKYAEDYMWRLMMFDGIVGGYFSQPTVFYEFGRGISTSKEAWWQNRLHDDWVALLSIMKKESHPDAFQKKVLQYYLDDHQFMKRIITKGKLPFWLKRRFRKRMSPTVVNLNDYNIRGTVI